MSTTTIAAAIARHHPSPSVTAPITRHNVEAAAGVGVAYYQGALVWAVGAVVVYVIWRLLSKD